MGLGHHSRQGVFTRAKLSCSFVAGLPSRSTIFFIAEKWTLERWLCRVQGKLKNARRIGAFYSRKYLPLSFCENVHCSCSSTIRWQFPLPSRGEELLQSSPDLHRVLSSPLVWTRKAYQSHSENDRATFPSRVVKNGWPVSSQS